MSPTQIAIQKIIEEVTAPLKAELRDCQIGIEQRNDLLKRMEAELKVAQDRVVFLGTITPCQNCAGSGKNAHGDCCRIPGHARECQCVLCQWKNANQRQARELTQVRAELNAAQGERDRLFVENQSLRPINATMREKIAEARVEIARLRQENEKEFTSAQAVLCADHAQTWYTARNELKPKSGCVFCDVNAELDRMRQALEDAPHGQDCCLAVSLTTCDREASEECKYVFAICLTHHPERAKCDCWKSRALNPQPAQPSVPQE